MADVHDVAAFLLREHGQSMSTWKLQKLVYYCQAWHLVWTGEPLFDEDIQAWVNGPVVYELYDKHRGNYTVSTWRSGDPHALTSTEQATVGAVLDFYGDKTGHWLRELTHMEDPWQRAREGLAPTERGSRVIPLEDMRTYYAQLSASTS